MCNSSKTNKWKFPILICVAQLLVILSMPVHAQATFVVNSTADSPDASSGDNICADSEGRCTLRAAIMQANALSGTDTIDLSQINDPNNPIVLSIPGVDEMAEKNAGGTWGVSASHDARIGDLNITDSVNIVGAGSGLTIIKWDPSVKSAPATGDRVFHVEAVSTNVEVNISGLTIQNGVTPPPEVVQTEADGRQYQLKRNGAGIAIGPAATVSLVDPNASGGGGGGGDGGAPPNPGGDEGETTATITGVTLSDVNVLDNQSGGDGGGIYNAAPLTLNAVTVSGNTAVANGGGIYNDAAMTVINSTIGSKASFATANSAEGGGGIFDTGMHTTAISGSTISGNSAVGGGGISARSLIIFNISNSTITGNSATDVGGGITTNGTVNLQNVTLADNSASSDATGGGAALNSFGQGTYNFINTLFSNNLKTGTVSSVVSCGCSGGTAACPVGRMVSGGHNLADDSSCSLTATGDMSDTASALAALADNTGPTETRALLSTDPAVDAGDNVTCPNTDQRGSLRPADGNLNNSEDCDIGAFELFIERADLHVERKNAPDSVRRGQSADIAVDFHNGDATTDATNVVVATDPLPAAFDLTSSTITMTGGSPSNCSFDAGTRVVTCAVGTLTPGTTATLDLKGTATTPGKLSLVAKVTSDTADTYPDNNTATINIVVIPVANLAVSASSANLTPDVDSVATIEFTVANNGTDPATNVRFLATLPSNLTFKSMTPSAGSCELQSDQTNVLCVLGTIAAGSSVTGTLELTANAEGDADVFFQATSDDAEADTTNDTSALAFLVKGIVPSTGGDTSSGGGSSGGGGDSGGCVFKPGTPFDPVLPGIIVASLFGVYLRRRNWAKSRGQG